MSYDLNLWTIDQVPATAIKELLPKAEVRDHCVQLEGDGWLITIENSVEVESEDIPDAVMAAWPGIAWMTAVNIEPIHGPGAVKREVKRVLKALAKDFRGVVEDPQADTVTLPTGSKRFRPPARVPDAKVSILNLNYWFTESPLRTRQGRERLIDYLARHIPEALPRRYGLVEPPSEKWTVGGKNAFLDFFDKHIEEPILVIYTSRPVVGLDLRPREAGWVERWGNRFFRCGCLKIEFEFAALEDPGWRTAIERAWLDVARMTQPFATNVEVIGGWFLRGNGQVCADGWSEDSVCVPAWFGVPRRLGLAFGLAEKYAEFWPSFREHATLSEGLTHVNAGDWPSRRSVSDTIGEAPEPIRERPGRGTYEKFPEGYPPAFFFADR